LSGEHEGEYYLAAKIRGFGDVTLQYFKSLKEAWKYSDEHADDLQHQAAEMEEQKKAERSSKFKGKDKPLRLRFNSETLRDRIGIDYRNGKDVSAKEFAKKFNFRAVEFGNSVSQKERQIALNALYDSLLDLANVLGISPEAMSLNGKLAFAYGARGVGNAEAHYEPEKNVVNLTKTRGAGNVAHEWWHALDYYFADSKSNPAMDGKYRDGIRPEIKKIFEELQKLFSGNSEYVIRAERLDAFTKKNYYTQPTEMAARAFTDYVSRQLEAQGQINDFLSSQVSETDWKGEENTYPYPTGEDAVKIGDTFQSLFNTLDEKTDDSGNTILFSKTGDGEQYADKIADIEAEMEEIRAKYEGTDQWMKAPNGKPTKLYEWQWLVVRTKAFKKWFGDWENDPENASKVVDENGEPLVMYHGTSSKEKFNIFDVLGARFGLFGIGS
jgi:transcriptional regulator with XRE-family HTH domain